MKLDSGERWWRHVLEGYRSNKYMASYTKCGQQYLQLRTNYQYNCNGENLEWKMGWCLQRDVRAQVRDQERTFDSLARGHVLKKKDKTTTYKLLLWKQHIHKWLDRKRNSLPPLLSRAHGFAGQNSLGERAFFPLPHYVSGALCPTNEQAWSMHSTRIPLSSFSEQPRAEQTAQRKTKLSLIFHKRSLQEEG